ncbi:DUF2303 family protein [Thalassospira lucentensis]|uniref:DUF2303 family protein n=1 Tax=Thalassospira lucentensis TaxID=168935 RepID=UPI003D2C14EA
MPAETPAFFQTETEAAHKLTAKFGDHKIVDVKHDGVQVPVIILPEGRTAGSVQEFIDEVREHPKRRKGTSVMQNLDSFVDMTNRFKSDFSAVFGINNAASADLSLTTVFDYHDPSETEDGIPRFMGHRCVYRFPMSDEWRAWMDQDDEWLDQNSFAEFLEEHIIDIAAPPAFDAKPDLTEFEKHLLNLISTLGSKFTGPSGILELSRGLSIRTEEKLESRQNLATGEIALKFSNEHQNTEGGKLVVPDLFLINIPVFKNGPCYLIPVRLRFRKDGAKVLWKFLLHRTELILNHAFGEGCDKVKAETELPLFLGAPE